MKILVTGANGFVGRAIVSELNSHELSLLDLKGPFPGGPNITAVEANAGDRNSLLKLDLRPVELVIHAAGLAHQFSGNTREAFWNANVYGTENAVELAARLNAKHFILISSVSVYGEGKGELPVTEESECRPVGLYAESKYESELAATHVCKEKGIKLTIFRLATVIGEGDRGNVSRLMRAIERGRFLWIGSGENRKSLVYKRDVARACSAMVEQDTPAIEILNVSAQPERMKDIVSFIAESLGKRFPKLAVPLVLLRMIFAVNSKILRVRKISGIHDTVKKWLSDETFSAEKFADRYGFRAETTTREAIRREVEWFLKNR